MIKLIKDAADLIVFSAVCAPIGLAIGMIEWSHNLQIAVPVLFLYTFCVGYLWPKL